MFARWDRMAKQFSRIPKKSTWPSRRRARSALNPALRRVIQNARAVNMPKDKVEAAIKRAVRQGRGELRPDHLRGLRAARRRGDRRVRDRQPDAHRRIGAGDVLEERRQSRRDG
jgi:hypothetical protein